MKTYLHKNKALAHSLFRLTPLFIIMVMIMGSCAYDGDEPNAYDPSPLTIHATIGKATRAIRSDSADQWSYVDFQTGDKMGFYSSSGRWDNGNGRNPFNNEELTFNETTQRFTAENGVEFSPSYLNGGEVMMYFPYSPEMSGEGMTLRTTKDDETLLRCVDLVDDYDLTVMGASGNSSALFGSFKHAFAELILMRGEGFDRPPEGQEQIKVYLSEPYTNVKVTIDEENGWSANTELTFDENNPHHLDQESAKEWEAWQGENYGRTIDNVEGYQAWYVVLPTVGCEVGLNRRPGMRTTVNYIELYDNEGELQRVTSLRLSGANTKLLDAGWRYPMLIAMKELVPTANPVNITPWNEDVNLTDERKRGINNANEFAEWVKAYNVYLLDSSKTDELLKYGDLYINEDKTQIWHFYILNDIDMGAFYAYIEGKEGYESDIAVPQLLDILDGVSTTYGSDGKFINHKVTGLSTTFIGSIKGNGQLQNLDFTEPDVRRDSSSPIGIISNSLNGIVTNCNIENGTLVNEQGPAGFVTGSMTGGTISNCNLEGFLVTKGSATGNAKGVVGEEPSGNYKLENINATIISD